jgi:lipoyl(octanoyl) transferase
MAGAAAASKIETRWLGRLSYDTAHQLQRESLEAVIEGRTGPRLLLLEHDPVVTFGRRQSPLDLRVPEEELRRRGIQVRQAERGGQATYHGPGQLVGYLIVPVRSVARDLPTFVWLLEEALIRTAADLGITAARDPRNHGIWVGEAKLAAIGLAVRRGISWHGFAFNVDPVLSTFDLIRPCGLELPATSIRAIAGSAPPVYEVAEIAARHIEEVFFPLDQVEAASDRSAR